ncbi:MAG: dual specificity protein phosphatase [Bacteroidota bacterium]
MSRGYSKLTGVPLLQFGRILPQLYVGEQYGKRGMETLREAGVTDTVNMRIEFDDAEHGLTLDRYCYLPTVDDTPVSLDHLREGAAFIRDAIDAGRTVYVHCAGGLGRAPSAAIAYLITTGLTFDEAHAKVRAGRPFVSLKPGQVARLREFEELV